MRKSTLNVWIVLAATAVLATACGDEDGNSTGNNAVANATTNSSTGTNGETSPNSTTANNATTSNNANTSVNANTGTSATTVDVDRLALVRSDLDSPAALESGVDFGYDTAISGDFALFSTSTVGPGTPNIATEVYVYQRQSDGGWNTSGTLSDGLDVRIDDRFGEAVAMEGPFAIVGAPSSGARGLLFPFVRLSDDSWASLADVLPAGNFSSRQFGAAVAIDGRKVIASAPSSYSIFSFEIVEVDVGNPCMDQPECWTVSSRGLLEPAEGGGISDFGRDLDISGNYAMATGSKDGVPRIYFFEYDEATEAWNETTVIDVDNPSGLIDRSVAISDERAVVGRPGQNSVELYDRQEDGTWMLTDTIAKEDPIEGFGRSVDLADGRLLIGAVDQGYLYAWDGSAWAEAESFQQRGDENGAFAGSLALDAVNRDQFAVGFQTPIGQNTLDGYATIFDIIVEEE